MQNIKNILLLHNVKKKFGLPQNHLDFLKSFEEFSVNRISYLDPSEDSLILEEINCYDVVVVHHSIILFSEYCLPSFWRILLRTSSNKKILFIQDDFRKVDQTLEIIHHIGFSVVCTCVSEAVKDKIYISSQINQAKVISILTAYVPESFKEIPAVSFQAREMDVVYRGRKGSAWYGDLVREKWIIGEKFKFDALLYGLKTNISSDEKDRIYGKKWIDFLLSAKCVLGTESSANVVDYDGSIEERVLKYEKDNPNASYEEIKNLYFKDIDGKIELNMLPPKIFEYAATRTLMVLYEGKYSGILEPWKHYVPLKKDHSNMEQVVECVRSQEKWEEMTQYAYNDLIESGKYSYRKLIDIFDKEIDELDIPTKKGFKKEALLIPLAITSIDASYQDHPKMVTERKILEFLRKIVWLRKVHRWVQAIKILLKQRNYRIYALNYELIDEIIIINDIIHRAKEIKEKTGILYPDKGKWMNYLKNKDSISDLIKDMIFDTLSRDPIFKISEKNKGLVEREHKNRAFIIKNFEKSLNELIAGTPEL
jgi:hypothetical protein